MDRSAKPVLSVMACDGYDIDAVRRAVTDVLAPLGGMARFVRPGMRVLLKPNLLAAAPLERAVTTHPAVVEAVTELVQQAGGTVLIGDSPGGPVTNTPVVWRASGMGEVAQRTGALLVPFDKIVWKQLDGRDYFIARPVFEADLVINLPKLKTHNLTLLTGAVKNLFGTVPGTRKRELHYRAPGVPDFSRILVDILELVRPALTILDGILGQEGYGPGASGTPRPYRCLVASSDPVALDARVAQALGCRPGAVLHVALAGQRGLGVADAGLVDLQGDPRALDFGPVRLPMTGRLMRIPAWMAAPLRRVTRVRPRVTASLCIGCGRCVEVCPRQAITPGQPPRFDLEVCVGCMCCAEICPQGGIKPHRSPMGRLLGAVD